ncbi:hypothetical protein BDR26DRAFT_1005310 [Obelidium mucronatum]|nr:hypothetical protein BDR26DRAFT_1005310 [Obelidium mucronatum]
MATANCVVTLPPNALTAVGLSTPWTVTGCDQTSTPTFAECTIVNSATGALYVYSPLLVNRGAQAGTNFIPPAVPILPPNAVVGCWFGTNGMTTTLADNNKGADLIAANCANGGVDGSIFGQFAACNAVKFFKAATPVVKVPPLGMGNNGKPCYTTRSFQIIDMDPSDNVVTTYLMDAAKKLAQKTKANIAALPGAQDVTNGSDNLLLDAAYRPALGCAPYTAPNLADLNGSPVGSLALNELQAASLEGNIQALIPPTDPFVVVNNQPNLAKQNMYRKLVNQQPATGTPAETKSFCQNMLDLTASGYITDIKFLIGQGTPDAANGKDLFTFLGQRFENSWMGLTCNTVIPLVGVNGQPLTTSPITANRDAAGVTQSLTFNTPALISLLMNNGGPTAEALVAMGTATVGTGAAPTTPPVAPPVKPQPAPGQVPNLVGTTCASPAQYACSLSKASPASGAIVICNMGQWTAIDDCNGDQTACTLIGGQPFCVSGQGIIGSPGGDAVAGPPIPAPAKNQAGISAVINPANSVGGGTNGTTSGRVSKQRKQAGSQTISKSTVTTRMR